MKHWKHIAAALAIIAVVSTYPLAAFAAWGGVDNFNSYSDGDLNGQSGGSGWAAAWSGSTAFDVQGSVVYEGAKAIIIDNAAGGNMSRQLTSAVTSGTVYVATRCTEYAGDAAIDFLVGSNIAVRVGFRDSGIVRSTNGAGNDTIIASFSTSIFYLFELTFNGDNTYNIRSHDGTTWSALASGKAYENTGNISHIRFNNGAMFCYHDIITATNPIVAAATFNFYQFMDF